MKLLHTCLAVLLMVLCTGPVAVAQTTTMDYSYYDGTTDLAQTGSGKKETYDVAIHINQPALTGTTIKGVIISIPHTTAVSNLKVWLSKKLTLQSIDGKKQNVPDICTQPADTALAFSSTYIPLDQPYTITEGGVYVGYTFTINAVGTDQNAANPLIVCESQNEGGFMIHSTKKYLKWVDQSDVANLAMKVRIDGVAANSASVSLPATIYTITGQAATTNVTVANYGANGVQSFDIDYFKPDSTSQTVKYVWRNDSIVLVNTTQDSKLLGMCTEAGEWYGYGDYIQQYTVFDQQPVAPKDETKATQMSITYYDSGQMYGRVKKAVREGNDIYIAGLNENIPSGWAKGTISGNKATFSGHQYMGLDTVTASYAFFEPVSHNMVWDSEIGDSIESLTLADAITFDYDADKGTLSTDSTFVANQGYKMFNQVFTYDGATLEPWTEKAATPLAVDASTMSYMPFSEEYGYGLLAFAPSEFDADGYILDANKLYYSIYLDDDVLTIDPDEYKLFPYETTEIPFTYSDMLDFVNYAGMWQVYTFVTGIDRIGVQMIYKGGGEVRKSAITYISATDEDPSAVSNVAQTGKVAGVTYTDLSGRRVSRPGKGLFIQTTRLADGTITTSKRLFK